MLKHKTNKCYTNNDKEVLSLLVIKQKNTCITLNLGSKAPDSIKAGRKELRAPDSTVLIKL